METPGNDVLSPSTNGGFQTVTLRPLGVHDGLPAVLGQVEMMFKYPVTNNLLLTFSAGHIYVSCCARIYLLVIGLHFKALSCLQCFDTVGWAAGRASGL